MANKFVNLKDVKKHLLKCQLHEIRTDEVKELKKINKSLSKKITGLTKNDLKQNDTINKLSKELE